MGKFFRDSYTGVREWAGTPFLGYLLISCLLNIRALANGLLIAPYNDALGQNYPLKHLYSSALKSFEFPFWNPYQFAGIPFLAEAQNGVLYPLNLVFYSLLDVPLAYNLSYLLHFALGAYFAFIYMRTIGTSKSAAFAGGVVFGFSGFLLVNDDHTAIVNSAIYMPFIMHRLELIRRERVLKHALVLGLASGVQLLAGNFQICFYTWLMAAAYLLFYIKEGGYRFIAMGTGGMALGLSIALPQIYANAELLSHSWMNARRLYLGFPYFSEYHLYLETLATLFLPMALSGFSPPDSVPIMLGAMPLVLAIAVFVRYARSERAVLFWGTVGLAALVLALGKETPLEKALYQVPVYNMFRVHGRHLFEFTFAVAVLFSLGLDRCFGDKADRGLERLSMYLFLAAGVLSLATLALPHVVDLKEYLLAKNYIDVPEITRRFSLIDENVNIPIGFIVLYALTMAALSANQSWWRAPLKVIIPMLVLTEIISIGGLGMAEGVAMKEARDLCGSTPVYRMSSEDRDLARVVNVVPRDIWWEFKVYNPLEHVTCGVSTVSGYDPLYLESYSDVFRLGLHGLGSLSWEYLFRNNVIISMQGGRYIRVHKELGLDLEAVDRQRRPPVRTEIPGLKWSPLTGAERRGDSFVLSPREGGAALMIRLSLKRGVYAVSFGARGKVNGFMGLYVYPDEELGELGDFEDHESELLMPADWMTEEAREFGQVIDIDRDGVYALLLVTEPLGAVEVSNPRLEAFDRYAPPFMAGEGGQAAYRKAGEDGEFEVYINNNALPRAWSVSRAVPVRGFDEVRRRLDYLEVDPSREAMLFEADLNKLRTDTFAPVEVGVESYGLNSMLLSTRASAEGFIVVSDQYFPGWRAYVDGAMTPIYQVNGFQRGVSVPGGEHEVLLIYRPYALMALMGLSLVIMAAIILSLGACYGGKGRFCLDFSLCFIISCWCG